MTGRRLSDQEFIAMLAASESRSRWDLDEEGRFLLLPLAERDLAWMLECCGEHSEGDYYVLGGGEAVLFEREHDFAFAHFLIL
jgi:hypothetical protein